MTLAPDIVAKVRASFARQSMMTTLDARLRELAPGSALITAPIRPETLQQQGAAHAALTFAIGDTAAGYAALTLFQPDDEVMTVEMKIAFLRPAVGDRLTAEGRVIKHGRRLSFVEANVYAEAAEARTHVARLSGTMIPVAR